MSQISKAIFGALAASLTLGAVQFATGQEFAGRFQGVTEPAAADINRTAKADREATFPGSKRADPDDFAEGRQHDRDLRVGPGSRQEARNLPPPPPANQPDARKPTRKMAVACEPTVSVLTEVAKLLQPGRCVT